MYDPAAGPWTVSKLYRLPRAAVLGAILFLGCGDGPIVGAPAPFIQYWNDWEPEWSPDGSRIAIRSNRSTRIQPSGTDDVLYDIGHNDLYLLDTYGNAVQVTDSTVGLPPSSVEGITGVVSLSWSSDGRIVFGSGNSLFIVDRDGSELQRAGAHQCLGCRNRAGYGPHGPAGVERPLSFVVSGRIPACVLGGESVREAH